MSRKHWFGPGYRVASGLYHSWQRADAVRHALSLDCPLVTIGRNGDDLSIDSAYDLSVLELAAAGMGPGFATLLNAQLCRDWLKQENASVQQTR